MRLVSGFLDQLFPETCLHCDKHFAEDGLLCRQCAETLCAAKEGALTANGHARHHALIYEGAAKSLFAAAKFSDRRRAQKQLQKWAVPSLQKLNTPESSFIEMPSSKPFLHNLLKRTVPPEKLSRSAFVFDFSQKGKQNKTLKEAQRFQRIAETLKLSGRPLPEAKVYILCDDVFTTGATLGHAAWLLRQKLALEPAQIQLWSLMYRPRQFEDEQI